MKTGGSTPVKSGGQFAEIEGVNSDEIGQQLQLIMESKASNWPKAMRMPSR